MENGDLYVQWFPGHMARTRRQIKESLPLVDAVVEIVDARVPASSRNSELPELMGISDRICVVKSGRIVAEYDRNEFDQGNIMMSAFGVKQNGGENA